MGNCAGYCGGCNENGTRFDANQIRNSIQEKDFIVNEDFGGLGTNNRNKSSN
jgi:hypothetical protein